MRQISALAGAVLAAATILVSAAEASQYGDAPRPVGITVEQPGTAGWVIERCILAAAQAQRLPTVMLVILLNVEDGRLGRVSGNANGTVDIGPMQVNETWLPEVAQHWGVSVKRAFLGLRDDFCANVEAGAWILRRNLDEARGDFWTGVGYYHSHDPGYEAAYLRKVLAQALRLQAAGGSKPATPPSPGAPAAPAPAASVADGLLAARGP